MVTGLRRVALIGNPNTGKTTLFNALTGLTQRTGNYPGVTVEKKTGRMAGGIELIDLPGAYSLVPQSPDELVAVQSLLGRIPGEARPDAVVVIADASNIIRSLYLVTQVIETGLPVVVALNMMDVAKSHGVTIDAPALEKTLGVPVVPTMAVKPSTLSALKAAIEKAAEEQAAARPAWIWPEALQESFNELSERLGGDPPKTDEADVARSFLLRRALIDEGSDSEDALAAQYGPQARAVLAEVRAKLKDRGINPAQAEIKMRYGWINEAAAPHVTRLPIGPTFTDRADAVLTHRFFGMIIFVCLMLGVFIAIFEWAVPIMDGIDALFGLMGEGASWLLAAAGLGGGPLESLVTDGIIAGVGGVAIFLPQILILFLFLAILEGCGYMARAAFLMDRLLRFAGLSGQSFVPLMSCFACAVPGIMAARSISSPRDRLVTVLIAPLMSCSARIPIYVIMVAIFVPADRVWGLSLQGMVFTAIYLSGVLVAIPVALLLGRTVAKGPPAPFIMELPTYKWPAPRTVFLRVYGAGKAFIIRAGTIILIASIIIWTLSYFPRPDSVAEKYDLQRAEAKASLADQALKERVKEIDRLESGEYLRGSIMGHMGRAIEPAVRPLGWDWRIGMAAIASFPAREIVIATLGIVYDLGDEVDVDEETDQLAMKKKFTAAQWPDGRPVFNLPVALSIMVFFALSLQCMATMATLKQETNSLKWPLFAFTYMTALAYLGALATYQAAMAIGLDKAGA